MEKTELNFPLNNHFYISRIKKTITDIHHSQYHSHETFELYYLLEGTRTYFIKDRTYVMEKGDLILIDHFDIHKNIDRENEVREGILIGFNSPFLETDLLGPILKELYTVFTSTKLFRLNVVEQNYIETILLYMVNEYKLQNYGYLILLKTHLIELLIWLKRKNETTPATVIHHANSIHEKISEIVKKINVSYANNITLTQLSKDFYISHYYLSRMFKEVTGFTLVEYIRSVRMLEAQKLLRDTNKSVTEIAQLTGFDSSTHFGRVFKEQKGCSPLKFRKQFKS